MLLVVLVRMCCVIDWPPAITDASKSVKSDVFKKQLEEAALIIKSTYWYVCGYKISVLKSSLSPYSELPSYDAVIPALLKHGVQELPNQCKLTPGQYLLWYLYALTMQQYTIIRAEY